MGKYQLDDKGKAQVRRFHEKQAREQEAKPTSKTALLEKMKKLQSQQKEG
ncbi:hypothetical protein [Streptococcus sp. NLN64]|nr:hypothetical protein [Streptococcus sp. NLN64]MBG9366949.1 hypothetical protein [Streptococcus sp. NLN64]